MNHLIQQVVLAWYYVLIFFLYGLCVALYKFNKQKEYDYMELNFGFIKLEITKNEEENNNEYK